MNKENLLKYAPHTDNADYSSQISRIKGVINEMELPLSFTKETNIPKSVTIQVTEDCNLRCSYCYQINKSHKSLDFETAKKFIDLILEGDPKINPIATKENSDAIILDFIGGETLLEIDLVDKIVDYFKKRTIELDHPWQYTYRISIGTNGVLYNTPKVQKFLNKNLDRVSLAITVDGNKELHDSCRVFPDGSGSYDLASAAVLDWNKKLRSSEKSTKLTIAPENLKYLKDANIAMIDLGFDSIMENCVYEEVWNADLAKEFYYQLKSISDYLLDNDLDQKIALRVFNPEQFYPMSPEDNKNWCGGDGQMLALDINGDIFNCVRYMKSSLGDDQKPLCIGNVDTGINQTEEHKCNYNCMSCITRRSQSTDKCFYCPIARGCGWCSAYNYQLYGTPNKRTTSICQMHTANALANVYHWNKVLKKYGVDDNFEMYCPKEWALAIIPEEEYNMLLEISGSKEILEEEWYAQFKSDAIEV